MSNSASYSMNNYILDKTFLILLSANIGGAIAIIFDAYLADGLQFFAVFLVVVMDLAFGVARALQNGTFETKKSFKGVYRLVAFWALLAVVIAIEKGFNYIDWMSEAVMMPIIVFMLISIVKNMHLIGLIPKSLLTEILSKVDKYKDEDKQDETTE